MQRYGQKHQECTPNLGFPQFVNPKIFYQKLGSVTYGALTSCKKLEETNEQSLRLKFGQLFDEFCNRWKQYPNLIDYIKKEKADVMSTCMRSDVRSICGLGYPPKAYTQNPNECTNRWLKDTLKEKPCKTITDVVNHLNGRVKQQTTEVVKSLAGDSSSGWLLDDTLRGSKFDIGNKFYQKTQSQRKRFVKAFNEHIQIDEKVAQCSSGPLSISAADSGVLFPPYQILEKMFSDAAKIIEDNSFVLSPGASDVYITASSDPKNPYKVVIHANGNIACECQQHKRFKICPHSVAIAEHRDVLAKFLKLVKKRKRSFGDVLASDAPSSSGKKSTQIRRGKRSKNSEESSFYLTKTDIRKSYPDPAPGELVVALRDQIHGKATSCYGCRQPLDIATGRVPEESIGTVIIGKAHRARGKDIMGNIVYTKDLRNVYYHTHLGCIRLQDLSARMEDVLIFPPHRYALIQQYKSYFGSVGIRS